MSTKNKKYILCILALISISIFFLEIQRNWTHVPYFNLKLTPSESKTYTTINIGKYLHKWSFTAYFTVWSNFLLLLFLSLSSFFKIKIKQSIKLILITYLLIASGIFWTLIAPWMPWGRSSYFDFINTYEHTFNLFISLLWLYFEKSKEKIDFKWRLSLIFPLIYLCFITFINGYSKGSVAVYQFLNVVNWFDLNLPLYLSIILFSISVFFASILIVGLYWFISRIVQKIFNY
ncbi:MAG: hypothetical protein HRT99_03975 [Mycoplasmatales bacterium]|nr:hypothetical protein [Mycoplasmatales bacterium]